MCIRKGIEKKWFASAMFDAFGRCAIWNVGVWCAMYNIQRKILKSECCVQFSFDYLAFCIAFLFRFVGLRFVLKQLKRLFLYLQWEQGIESSIACAQRKFFFLKDSHVCFLLSSSCTITWYSIFYFCLLLSAFTTSDTHKNSARVNHKHDEIEFTVKS